MDTFPNYIPGLDDEQIRSFSETYDVLRNQYSTVFDRDFVFSFKGFASFSGYYPSITEMMKISKNGRESHIAFTENTYSFATYRGGRGMHTDFQLWGIANLKNNFGRVIIRSETLEDKIQEWLQPVEIDFEDDAPFSKKYYVIAEQKEMAMKSIDQSFRDAVMNIPGNDFSIEIKNQHLIIGDRKSVNPASVIAIADFINKVSVRV